MNPSNDNIDPDWLLLPKTRAEAKRLGSNRYFTGLPCINGHIAPRGTSYGCIVCDKLRSEQKRQTQEYRDHYNAWARKKYAEDPERYRLKVRILRESNIDRALEKERATYKRTKPERDRRRKKWRKENPDKVVAQNHRRRAAKLNAEGSYSSDDVAVILRRQNYRCAECGVSVRKRSDRHVDHIMPLSLGGTNASSNLQILCVTCNCSKGAKHPLDWAKAKGSLV